MWRPEGLRALLAAFDRLLENETDDEAPTVAVRPVDQASLKTAKATKTTKALKTSERPEATPKTENLFDAVHLPDAGGEAEFAPKGAVKPEAESSEFPDGRENRKEETAIESGRAPLCATTTGARTSSRKTSSSTANDEAESRPLRSWEIWGGW